MSNDTKKEKTREELKEELEAEKREAWEKFKTLNYDQLDEEGRKYHVQELYDIMNTRIAPEPTHIPYDFWQDNRHLEKLKEIKRFISHVENTLENVPEIPTKEVWLDRERGIIPNMKRDWKEKISPFKDEHALQEHFREKANEILSKPENQKQDMTFIFSDLVKKALENIEETGYKPTRAKIEEIETEIKKRVQ